MKFVKRNGVTYFQQGNEVFGFKGETLAHEIVIECRNKELPLESLIEIAEIIEMKTL